MGTSSVSILACAFAVPLLLSAGTASETAQALRSVELDPGECYRIRELEFQRGGVRFFLTDGYVAFSKPVDGAPVAAVFSADVPGGDGEFLLLPPTSDERRILNQRAGAPNIDEHLRDAAFFFADDTAAELKKQMDGKEWIHRDPDLGARLAERYNAPLRALVSGFETHLLLDLLNHRRADPSYFVALKNQNGSYEVLMDRANPDKPLRFRPDPRLNTIIREVARENRAGVGLVDAARQLGSDPESIAPPAGHELFFEHVHFDWEGNYQLARLLAQGTEAMLGESGASPGA